MALKRRADEEAEGSAAAKRKVDELMKLVGDGGQGGASTSAATASTSRQMQGQSAESGMHSIDSDEEEEYERSKRVERMADDDYDGVEDSTIERDGQIQITPFNLKDEEEEGHFAKDGNFIWNKKKDDEATDSWLENVDWGKVQERSEAEKAKQDADDEAEDEAEAMYNETDNYKAILTLLKPKESVAKALRRLGGGKKTTAQKLKEKKRQKEGKETQEEKRNREDMAQLTSLADAILSRSGHMEIYEETFESITFKLKEIDGKKAAERTEIPEGVDDDDALDMFMESAKEREEDKSSKPSSSQQEGATEEAANPPETLSMEDEVKWEYRWEDSDTAEIHGPHTSAAMQQWKEGGFFDKTFFVRKTGSGGDFRDGKRIDFSLFM